MPTDGRRILQCPGATVTRPGYGTPSAGSVALASGPVLAGRQATPAEGTASVRQSCMKTREQIYADLWSEPLWKVAKRYRVKPSYLRYVCECLKIPRPPRGYWQRTWAGFQDQQKRLPAAVPGAPTSWVTDGSEPVGRVSVRSVPSPRERRKRPPPTHPLVVEARHAFTQRRNPTQQGYLVPRKFNVMDIVVTEKSLSRALKFADLLFGELERHGHAVTMGEGFSYSERLPADEEQQVGEQDRLHRCRTVTHIGDVTVGLTILEIGGLSRSR